ncbi:hypothetical protein ES319_D13G156100v1, partial [Gossypium barbadense]
MYSPYSASPQPNRCFVGGNVITSRINSVSNTPRSRNRYSPIQRRLGNPYPFLIFVSFFALIDFCFFFHMYCRVNFCPRFFYFHN